MLQCLQDTKTMQVSIAKNCYHIVQILGTHCHDELWAPAGGISSRKGV